MRNKYSCTSEFVCIQVMYFNSRSRHGCQRHSLFKFPDWQSNVHFLWPNELTICADINGFQIPVETSCTGHRWCKAKDFFVFCSGQTCLACFHGFLFFFCFICHLCLSHEINAQTPITANLSTYLIHEFLVNVKCRTDLIGNPISPWRLISWYNVLPMEHV